MVSRHSRMNSLILSPLAISLAVKRPCVRALRLPLGAPERGAQPWLRQRRLPSTGGRGQGEPSRRRAPQLSAGGVAARFRPAPMRADASAGDGCSSSASRWSRRMYIASSRRHMAMMSGRTEPHKSASALVWAIADSDLSVILFSPISGPTCGSGLRIYVLPIAYFCQEQKKNIDVNYA
jgi:hypothetical protein